MLLPLDWLEERLPGLPDAEVLAERLTLAGLEIEEIRTSEVPAKVVIGHVVQVDPHPDADRLRVCIVDVGGDAPATIVCGAPNVAAGQFVPVAMPGARMPGGMKIKKGKLRGVRSEGMICSEKELELGEGQEGILVLSAADFRTGGALVAGEALCERLPAVTVLDVAITPNRGDCISVLGIARDASAIFGLELQASTAMPEGPRESTVSIDVAIEAGELCPWYCAQAFSFAGDAVTPLWMRRRLEQSGVRALSPLVDLTNYVMLELGQPMHAFDLDCLQGGGVVVRRAVAGEKLVLLDSREIELGSDELVIADAAGPVALAGVMGGARAEVSASTRTILLESAVFDPCSVRRTARRIGVHSEASFRFEREVDGQGAAHAIDFLAELGGALGLAAAGPCVMAGDKPAAAAAITLEASRPGQLLGVAISESEIVSALESLGAKVSVEKGVLTVWPPSYRNDWQQEADLVEEVARLRGFDRIPTTLPRVQTRARQRTGNFVHVVRTALCGRGLSEALTLSFAEPSANERFPGIWTESVESVAMRNPLATVAREMRRSLLPGLLEAARLNRSRDASFVPLFTTGRIFAAEAQAMAEERRAVAMVVAGSPPVPVGATAAPITFLGWKGLVESALEQVGRLEARWVPGALPAAFHPGQAASLVVGDRRLGVAGALHPRIAGELDLDDAPVWLAELDLDFWKELAGGHPQFSSLARHPVVRRDVALLLAADLPAGDLLARLQAADEPLLETVTIFDEYAGDGVPAGKKSLAFSFAFRASDRTLTDEEVSAAQATLLEGLAEKYQFELR
jgi:phenylalanyl-tRNA synthetase beta chain